MFFKVAFFLDGSKRCINFSNWQLRIHSPSKKFKNNESHECKSVTVFEHSKNQLVFQDPNFELFEWILSNIQEFEEQKVIWLPYGFSLRRQKNPTKIIKKNLRFPEQFEFKGKPFSKKYISEKFASWRTQLIDSNQWERIPTKKKCDYYNSIGKFELFAFDFESRPSDQTAVIVCLTQMNLSTEEIISVADFAGFDCELDLLDWCKKYLDSSDNFTTAVILGFNSARYDNIFLARGLSSISSPYKICYLESKGRIIDITIQLPSKNSQVMFRDVLLYYPVGLKQSLKNMAISFKLDHQKADCSLEEMEYVGNLILNNPKEKFYKDETFLKEMEYCRQDTRVVYGLAKIIGQVFCKVELANREMFSLNPNIPSNYSYLVWFFTLAQTSFKLLPLFLEEDYTEGFTAVKDLIIATFLKNSIYGGRTLAGDIARPHYAVSCTDITSEYPSAMNGPMPNGDPFFPSLKWVNEINDKLKSKKIWDNDQISFVREFPEPFIAYINFCKPREMNNRHFTNGEHIIDQVLPFIPHRKQTHSFITNPLPNEAKGNLEWLSDTDGQIFQGVYNCVHIYLMKRLGFKVEISTCFRPVVWPRWSISLGMLYSKIYESKAIAKKAGDSDRELMYKILLNSSIGKMAQNTVYNADFDGIVYRKKKPTINRTLFQLNSFCMAWSHLINIQHLSLICYNKPYPDFDFSIGKKMIRSPIYCDTDNLIFSSEDLEGLEECINRCKLTPRNDFLCEFNFDFTHFTFTLEFEGWHKCPKLPFTNAPLKASLIIMGKKSYVMQCNYCHEFRVKAKGHRKTGINTEDFAKILRSDPPLDINYFLNFGENLDGSSSSARMFMFMKPELDEEQAYKQTSGVRFTMQISLPSSGIIKVLPSTITRRYCANIPINQTRCPICNKIVHI